MKSHISEFSEFFFHKDRLNIEINTKKTGYGTLLVLFLNYIFIEREETLESIEDITIEIGNEFLNKYVYGEIGCRKTKEGANITKTDEVIEAAENSLTSFYYWLCVKAKKNGNKNRYNLKYINKDDFEFKVGTYKNRNNPKFRQSEYKVLKSIFTVQYPHKPSKSKLESPDELIVYTLIEIARQYDPMLAFPIALQAFSGLRRGEVCQMTRKRISNRKPIGTTVSFYIDLQEEYLLRDDGVRTGAIKRPRVQLVYEAFLPYLDKLYREHMNFLREKGLDSDGFGALIFGYNRKALTTSRYAARFNGLIPILLKRLSEMSGKGNVVATTDYDLLLNVKMTPHSLRYFFTEYVARREPTHILAMYRGDLNLNTALKYLKSSRAKLIYIKEIQESFEQSYFKMTGSKII